MTENKQAANRRIRKLAHGPSPYQRAVEIAPAHSNATLMQRMEDPSLRQLWRLTNTPSKARTETPTQENVKK